MSVGAVAGFFTFRLPQRQYCKHYEDNLGSTAEFTTFSVDCDIHEGREVCKKILSSSSLLSRRLPVERAMTCRLTMTLKVRCLSFYTMSVLAGDVAKT